MTRPIRNTGPCFPSGLPRQRGQRDVLSHTEFYTPIFCMLSVFQAIPFRVTEKATHGEQMGLYSWHSRMGTSITINIVPKCEVCPRDHGKVVESLRGKAMCWKAGDPWAFLNCQDSLLPFTRRKPTANRQHTVLIRVFTLSTTAVKQSVYFNPTDRV